MKYYKDSNNKVYAYESDGSQDSYIKPGLTPITLEVANSLRNVVPTVPTEVSMAQARLALHQEGYLQHATDYINGLVGSAGDAARIEWEFRTHVKRSNPLVAALQVELALTDAQMDGLFITASSL